MQEKPRKKSNRLIRRLKTRIALDKNSFILYSVLRTLVIITMIRCFFLKEYENVGLCILALVLFLIPAFAEESLKIEIPVLFESIIYIFIYAAWILGEIQNYYVLIPGWDTMLHTMNGFLCAAVGFSLVDLLNQKSKNVQLSPLYVSLVAFCFSMTIGVLWEFIEFFCDHAFALDMQKDAIITSINTVKLTSDGSLSQIHNITKTVIHTSGGQVITISGGYLDVGLLDTMKDLFVNFIGAIAFSIIGYNYITRHQAGSIAPALQIRPETEAEAEEISDILDHAEDRAYVQEKSAEARQLFGRKDSVSGGVVVIGWIDILISCADLILMYRSGSVFIKVLYIAVKIGVIAGIGTVMLASSPKVRSKAYWVWIICSVISSMLTVYKWMLRSTFTTADIWVYLIAISADLVLPIIITRMYRKAHLPERANQSKVPDGKKA